MPRYASKPGVEDPYTIPNKGPTPKIDREEGFPPGGLDIAWVEDSRKNDYHWSRGLPWHDRLHAHATMNSARRNVKCKRPFEPKDDLDFILGAAYCPTLDTFFEKTDPYLQIETALGEDMNLKTEQQRKEGLNQPKPTKSKNRQPKYLPPPMPLPETWRLLRNRVVMYPDKSVPRGYAIVSSGPKSGQRSGGAKRNDGGERNAGGEGNGGGEDEVYQRRENIHNVKLGIAAYHSPQTNPGYSRTPSGAFYSI